MAFGPAAGLSIADTLRDEPALGQYPYLPAVRGEMLERLGDREGVRGECERAAALTQNARERTLLRQRVALAKAGPPTDVAKDAG